MEQAKEATNDTVKAASDKVNSDFDDSKGTFQRAGEAVSNAVFENLVVSAFCVRAHFTLNRAELR